jgi:hypothetical protein
MSNRSPSTHRSWILSAALVAATGGAASVGRTQQVSGSIGVSLTILPPIAGPQPRVTEFDIGRDSVTRIGATLPSSALTSQLVMVFVSSSSTEFTPEPQPSTLVPPSSSAVRMLHLVKVKRDRRTPAAQPMALRVEYLIVAGT